MEEEQQSSPGSRNTGDVKVGDTLGRYQLLLPIAAGGMGKVWAARQLGALGFKKLVAVKTTLPELSGNANFEKLFLDEARIASSIHHPQVCSIYELGDERGVLYLAMELVDGGALSSVLSALPGNKRVDLRVAARIIAQACAGLHAAHELKDEEGELLHVVHRDISPHNILISADGHVKVTDFGIVKARGQLHQKTETGEFKGKVAYLAPETLTSKDFDRRADIFALGCVLYQATVGERPFRGDDVLITMYQILESNMEAPSSVMPDFPPDLEAIIMKALARKPDDRFMTAEDMRIALENWLARSGPLVTEAHIAKLVRETLGGSIEERRRGIKAAVDGIALAGRTDLPMSDDGRGGQTAVDGTKTENDGSSDTLAVATVPRRSKVSLGGMVAIGFAVSVMGGTIMAARRSTIPSANATVDTQSTMMTSTAPAAAERVTPAPPAANTDEHVTVTVEARPASATIFLDNVVLSGNPYTASVPKDGKMHVVRAQAHGYSGASRQLVYNESQSIELVLTRSEGQGQARRTPTATPSVAPTEPATVAPQPVKNPGPVRRKIDQSDPFREDQ